jgi:hypothetical protein
MERGAEWSGHFCSPSIADSDPAAPKPTGTVRRAAAAPLALQSRLPSSSHARKISDTSSLAMFALPVMTSRSSGESISAQANPLPATLHAPAGGLLQKNQHVSDVLSRAKESISEETWDDDFAEDTTLSNVNINIGRTSEIIADWNDR